MNINFFENNSLMKFKISLNRDIYQTESQTGFDPIIFNLAVIEEHKRIKDNRKFVWESFSGYIKR